MHNQNCENARAYMDVVSINGLQAFPLQAKLVMDFHDFNAGVITGVTGPPLIPCISRLPSV